MIDSSTNLYNSYFIQHHFNTYAKKYWLAELLSFGLLKKWREKCIDAANLKPGSKVCDMMSGSGNNFYYLHKKVGLNGNITGIDCSFSMNQLAYKKIKKRLWTNVQIIESDFLQISPTKNYFDSVICSFGIKMLCHKSLIIFAHQIKELLRPEGTFAFIELTLPKKRILRKLFLFYLKYIVPLICLFITGSVHSHWILYNYACKSDTDKTEFLEILRQAGLIAYQQKLTIGFATLYYGVNPKNDFLPLHNLEQRSK